MTDVASSAALAAAVAAAAEIAKHGGAEAFLFAVTAAAAPESDVLESTTTAVAAAANSMMIAEQLYATKTTPEDEDTKKGEFTMSSSVSPDEDDHDLMDEDDEEEPDAEKRLARSRERNREHARRTRLRKKAQLEALQAKVKGLEAEGRKLRQALEECNIASILVGLSGGANGSEADETGALVDEAADAAMSPPPDQSKIALLVAGKRKRFISDDMIEKPCQPLKLHIDGQTTLIGGGKTHINWKTGVYSDENGAHRQLTSEQLETLRRERNRMHAKMTRDRKKCFIKTIESTIDDLERENKRLRDLLSSKTITPQPSPMLTATEAVHAVEEAPLLCSASSTPSSSVASSPCPSPPMLQQEAADVVPSEQPQPSPKVTHGFSLIG